ncbi:MAG TPA: hypothetical protein VKV22_04805 [Rhodanobacteraceae bacterium]|nr:hypothetical protein [Rhodanobacteraceae bacterium]
MKSSRILFAVMAFATGLVDVLWGAFEPAHEPIQAFGDHVWGQTIFAYVVAVVLMLGGLALLTRKFVRAGALAAGVCYLLFAIFNVPRLISAPRYLGIHLTVFVGVLDGVFQQLILVGAAAMLYAVVADRAALTRRTDHTMRWLFGIACVDFGLAHVLQLAADSPFVPAWMPLGQKFWVAFTGVAMLCAGVAFLVRRWDVLAARLLALMFLIFSLLTVGPQVFQYPHAQAAWGSNTFNLAAVASAWIFAEWLAARAVTLRKGIPLSPDASNRPATP